MTAGDNPVRANYPAYMVGAADRDSSRSRRWTYRGLGLETPGSAQYRVVDGQLNRSKKSVTVRGLNKDHSHDLKDIFKVLTAEVTATKSWGPTRTETVGKEVDYQ